MKIKFKLTAAAYWVRVETRKVLYMLDDGCYVVKAYGYDDFVVKPHEVIEVINGRD